MLSYKIFKTLSFFIIILNLINCGKSKILTNSLMFNTSHINHINNEKKDPPVAEDGNELITKWYYSPQSFIKTKEQQIYLENMLKSQGIQPIDIQYHYKWIQDIAIFSVNGNFLVQANMPKEVPDLFYGLTMGVYYYEVGEPLSDIKLTKISAQHMAKLGIKSRQMEWTFIEGGGIWTGRFPDGSYYAILDWYVIKRAQDWYRYKTGKSISFEEAKGLVAFDLQIPEENVFPIFTGAKHLDTFMLPLWDQTILLAELDPIKIIEFLNQLLRSPKITKKEQQIINLIIKGYMEEPHTLQHLSWDFPYQEINNQTIYENIYNTLSLKFKIKKVFGFLNNIYGENGDKEAYISRNFVNFFNAFSGINPKGQRFMFTNHAHGLKVLENYWISILQEHGYLKENIFFVSEFEYGGGIDCAGAISKK